MRRRHLILPFEILPELGILKCFNKLKIKSTHEFYLHFMAGPFSHALAFHLLEMLAGGCIVLMTNLDCFGFVFSSPTSHLCLQEPNTPWSQHFALPKTCSTTRSEATRSLARIRRGHARVPAWRRRLVAIRRSVSKCSGEKGKSRNAVLQLRELRAKKHHCCPTRVSRAVEELVAGDQGPQMEKKLWSELPQPHRGVSSPHG